MHLMVDFYYCFCETVNLYFSGIFSALLIYIMQNLPSVAPPSVSHRGLVIFILGLLATIDPFSIDFYLPAFAQIAKDVHSTPARVSLSISSYFIGLAFGQLLYGPIVDRFGRKRPLYIGMFIYMLTCVACTRAHSIEALVIYRFFQALAGSVAAVTTFAMVRDFFPVKESAKIFSMLVLIIGISPLAAPTVGGFITAYLGWQWVFILLVIIVGLVLLLTFLYLPPAAPPNPLVSLKPKPIVLTFWSILKNAQFITYTLSGTFAFATLFIYVAGSPVIFLEVYKVTPRTFGLIFSLLSCGFIGSSQINILLLRRYKSKQIFTAALYCHSALALVFLIGVYNGWFGMVAVIVMFLLTLACLGSINPNASALALAPLKNNIGSASALMGCLQIGIAGTMSAFIGVLDLKNMVPVPALMLATSLIALLILGLGTRRIKQVIEPETVNQDDEMILSPH
jgi:DHA1 family bicyclomycin/chloramphenicol resistance-like MFS transporter